MQLFRQYAETQQLPRAEHVSPFADTVDKRTIAVAMYSWLKGKDVLCFPLAAAQLPFALSRHYCFLVRVEVGTKLQAVRCLQRDRVQGTAHLAGLGFRLDPIG